MTSRNEGIRNCPAAVIGNERREDTGIAAAALGSAPSRPVGPRPIDARESEDLPQPFTGNPVDAKSRALVGGAGDVSGVHPCDLPFRYPLSPGLGSQRNDECRQQQCGRRHNQATATQAIFSHERNPLSHIFNQPPCGQPIDIIQIHRRGSIWTYVFAYALAHRFVSPHMSEQPQLHWVNAR